MKPRPEQGLFASRKNLSVNMAIGNGKLMHECFPKHMSMGTARMKEDGDRSRKAEKNNYGKKKSGIEIKKFRCLAIDRVYVPSGTLLPKVVD